MPIRPARRERLARCLDLRLGHVRCAAEAIHHRHNVSAILRTCEALGIHHVHLVTPEFRPSSSALGAARWLEIHLHDDARDAIDAIQGAGFDIWIADLADECLPPEQVPLDRPVCPWFGAELVGVGEAATRAATGVVSIPMRGLAQSLNVSVAAALTLRPIAERARTRLGDGALLGQAERARIWSSWLDREG